MDTLPEPILVLRPQPARRAIAFSIQTALGALLLWVALARPPEAIGWRLFLLGLGLGALGLALRGWQRGGGAVVLDRDGLRDEAGEPIAPLGRIARVDRGTFAFKPSNGFVVHLTEGLGRAWSPGLWWRVGRRVGVGGVTGGAEGRAMADALAAMVRARAAGEG